MGHVLIVEDNADLRYLYQVAVKNEGHTPMVASNGKEALEQLQKASVLPHLILLDLMMPVMDGWQFLEERKKDSKLCDIPVILCSAAHERMPEHIEFLKKPVDLKKLVEVLDKYCT